MLHGRGRLGLQQQYEGQGRHHYGKEGYGQNIYSFGAAAGNGKTQGLDIAIATTWIGVEQEIDYLEECDGQFSLFEMKWNPKRANTKFPASFLSAYQVKDKCIVTPENWIDWVIE